MRTGGGYNNVTKIRWSISAFLLICWMPVWLAYYPGGGPGDTNIYQYEEYMDNAVSRSFPVMHTWYIGSTIHLGELLTGSKSVGIALSTVIQMVILAAIFSYVITYFYEQYRNKAILIFMTMWYAFHPVMQMFVKNTVRDTLFSAFVLLSGVMLYRLCGTDVTDIKMIGASALILFVTVNLRNAAVFFLVAMMAGALIALCIKRNTGFKTIIVTLAIVFIAQAVFVGGIRNRVTIQSSVKEGVARGTIEESFSVPIQQIMRTIRDRGADLDAEERNIIGEVLPIDETEYRDQYADWLKYHFNTDRFLENPMRYVSVWAKWGLSNPESYLEAMMMLNYEAWYPDNMISNVRFLTGTETVYAFDGISGAEYHDSKIPWLFDFFNDLAETISFQKVPLMVALFSPAVMLYLLIIAFGYFMYIHCYREICFMIIPLLIHVGTFFGPMFVLRYFLASFMVAPVIIVSVLYVKKSAVDSAY